jgi:phage-related protein
VREFPPDARSEVGYQLYKVQVGLEPTDWKPMPSVGGGVREIRIHVGNEYRVIYLATRRAAIYVLHAFVKKTPRTAQADIELARKRLASIRQGRSVL